MATKGFDNTVFVEEGVYDLIQEFKDYYGNDFFENYTSSEILSHSTVLKERKYDVSASDDIIQGIGWQKDP
jgi:hypothetical protein